MDLFHSSCKTEFQMIYIQESLTEHDQSSCSSSSVFVHIDFSGETTRRYVVDDHVMEEGPEPEMSTSICFGSEIDDSEAYRITSEALVGFPMPPWQREHIVGYVTQKAREEADLVKLSSIRVLNFGVNMQFHHTYELNERALLQLMMSQHPTMFDTTLGHGMLPASTESIRSLKRKRVDTEEGGESCMICLEQFAKGSMVKVMPCSHIFHEDCITKWLETSHYCPICRFEMPTT